MGTSPSNTQCPQAERKRKLEEVKQWLVGAVAGEGAALPVMVHQLPTPRLSIKQS